MVPTASNEAFFANGLEERLDRAVIEKLRRLDRFESEIDRYRMPLAGPDTPPVLTEGKPLLVVLGHNPLQQLTRKPLPMALRSGQQHLDVDPAVFIERDADAVGTMPQHVAEKLAGLDVGHG